MPGRYFECSECNERIEVPDTVPNDEVDGWLEDHGWSRVGDPQDDEWMCENCSDENGVSLG